MTEENIANDFSAYQFLSLKYYIFAIRLPVFTHLVHTMRLTVLHFFPQRFRGYLAVLGCFLLCLANGAGLVNSNVLSYLLSYLKLAKHEAVSAGSISWVPAVRSILVGLLIPCSGLLESKIGSRPTIFLGCIAMLAGQLLSCFAVDNFYVAVFTLAALPAAGYSWVIPVTLSTASAWFPGRSGAVSGFVTGGITVGEAILNGMVNRIVNPANVKPVTIQGTPYFVDEDVVSRLPYAFFPAAVLTFVCQCIGLLVVRRPANDQENNWQTNSSSESLLLLPSTGESDTQGSPERSVKRVLKSRTYHLMFLTHLCRTQLYFFILSYLTLYGLKVTGNDNAVAITNSVGMIAGSFGHLFWGAIADRFEYQITAASMCAMSAFLFLTLGTSIYGGIGVYSLWTIGMFFNWGGSVPMIFQGVRQTFGATNVATNLGLVMAAQVPGFIFAATVMTLAFESLKFSGTLLLFGCIQMLGLLCVILTGFTADSINM